jgi:hypothetical protein
MFRDLLGKDSVRIAVGDPGIFVETDLTGMVVEQRPKNRVYRLLKLARDLAE